MLSVILASVILGTVQMPEPGPSRPAVECAEHLTDLRARRACLESLLEASDDALEAAVAAARTEAAVSDLDSGGLFRAEANLEAAQSAWLVYRDAECSRRGALMFISDEAREEIGLDCRIALNRARTAELREM